jgi:hypothetical protein
MLVVVALLVCFVEGWMEGEVEGERALFFFFFSF